MDVKLTVNINTRDNNIWDSWLHSSLICDKFNYQETTLLMMTEAECSFSVALEHDHYVFNYELRFNQDN